MTVRNPSEEVGGPVDSDRRAVRRPSAAVAARVAARRLAAGPARLRRPARPTSPREAVSRPRCSSSTAIVGASTRWLAAAERSGSRSAIVRAFAAGRAGPPVHAAGRGHGDRLLRRTAWARLLSFVPQIVLGDAGPGGGLPRPAAAPFRTYLSAAATARSPGRRPAAPRWPTSWQRTIAQVDRYLGDPEHDPLPRAGAAGRLGRRCRASRPSGQRLLAEVVRPAMERLPGRHRDGGAAPRAAARQARPGLAARRRDHLRRAGRAITRPRPARRRRSTSSASRPSSGCAASTPRSASGCSAPATRPRSSGGCAPTHALRYARRGRDPDHGRGGDPPGRGGGTAVVRRAPGPAVRRGAGAGRPGAAVARRLLLPAGAGRLPAGHLLRQHLRAARSGSGSSARPSPTTRPYPGTTSSSAWCRRSTCPGCGRSTS